MKKIKPSDVIGNLTVIKQAEASEKGAIRWVCLCSCGNEVIYNESLLLRRDCTSCGCCVNRAKDLTGMKFGRLTVLERTVNAPDGRSQWRTLCDCGNTIVASIKSLHWSKVPSCGCYTQEHIDNLHKASTKHGLHSDPIYKIWVCMKKRCYNTKRADYKRYGGRGIYVCERWLNSFQNFYDDMHIGYKKGLQIDRIDNDGPYSPENCRWVTPKENSRNKSSNHYITTALGRKIIADQAELSGLTCNLIGNRLKLGMPEGLAIIPRTRHKLAIKTLQKLYSEDAVWMSEKQFENVCDVFTIAEIQARAIKEWGFGPREIILAP